MSRTTSPGRHPAPLIALCAAALVLLALAGCGDDTSPSSAPSASRNASPGASPGASVEGFAPASAEITAAVRDAWDRYGEAVTSRDGDAAVALVASSAWPMYERQRKLALTAAEKELRDVPLFDQLSALMLRARVKPARLRSTTPQELFAVSVDQGLLNEAGAAENRLGEVTTDGAFAYAEQVHLGQVTENKITFRLEDGTWKLDLIPMMRLGEYAVFLAAMSEGKTVDEYVDLLMKRLLGPAKARTIWEPVDPT